MKNKFKAIASLSIISILCLEGIVLSKVPNVKANWETQMANVDIASPVHYPKSYNHVLKQRIRHYAKTRRAYHQPDITFSTEDLGGLPVKHHKVIKRGKLYRSANLHYLNKKGAKQIKKDHIKQIDDLRAWHGPNHSIIEVPGYGEDSAMPDIYHLHLHYHHYPVASSYIESLTWKYRLKYGESYRFGYWYSLSPVARKQYRRAILMMLYNKHGNILYDCTQGRDRTGTLSIIIENLLGVSKHNIYNDFLLVNHYHYQSSYLNQIARINTFYYSINRQYGDIHNYEHQGLHLTNHQIHKFRHKYLTNRN